MERFAQYAFAPWPDGELLERVARFRIPGITRIDQKFTDFRTLLVEVGDMAYAPTGKTGRHLGEDGQWCASPNGAPKKLHLIWDGLNSTIFALES